MMSAFLTRRKTAANLAAKTTKADDPKDDDKDTVAEDTQPKPEDEENDSSDARSDSDPDDDDGDKDENGNPKTRSRRATTDDDDDTEMRGNSPVAQARMRERARCAAIMAAAAPGQVESARHLAFDTSMSRVEAVKLLSTLPKGAAPAAAAGNRADKNPRIAASTGPAVNAGSTPAGIWDKAIAKANRR